MLCNISVFITNGIFFLSEINTLIDHGFIIHLHILYIVFRSYKSINVCEIPRSSENYHGIKVEVKMTSIQRMIVEQFIDLNRCLMVYQIRFTSLSFNRLI